MIDAWLNKKMGTDANPLWIIAVLAGLIGIACQYDDSIRSILPALSKFQLILIGVLLLYSAVAALYFFPSWPRRWIREKLSEINVRLIKKTGNSVNTIAFIIVFVVPVGIWLSPRLAARLAAHDRGWLRGPLAVTTAGLPPAGQRNLRLARCDCKTPLSSQVELRELPNKAHD